MLINELPIPTVQWDNYLSNVNFHKKHTPLPHFKRKYLNKVRFVFAFVRRPVGLYQSLWSFTKDRADKDRKIVEEPIEGSQRWLRWKSLEYPCCWSDDFNEWAVRLCTEYPGFATRMYERFIGPEHLEYCHFVGRHERLVDDLLRLLHEFGYEWVEKEQLLTEPVNRTPTEKPTMEPEVFNLIMKTERLAIKRFYGKNYDRVYYRSREDDMICSNG